MLTAYDCPTARVLNDAELDVILVGDSLGMVVLGFEDTRSVTMADMLHHTRAVARGNTECLIVSDLPFGAYESPSEAVGNARLLRGAGADAVKPEGKKLESIKAIIADGIPVMGHVGLLPQTSDSFRVHGRKPSEAAQILSDAKALEAAGCFAIVLEGIPARLAKEITAASRIPTIGIGAGAACDGQVLVLHDLMGFFDQFNPTFAKKYAELGQDLKRAVTHYRSEVKQGLFPDKEHTYH